jgi:hypothetical protein
MNPRIVAHLILGRSASTEGEFFTTETETPARAAPATEGFYRGWRGSVVRASVSFSLRSALAAKANSFLGLGAENLRSLQRFP